MHTPSKPRPPCRRGLARLAVLATCVLADAVSQAQPAGSAVRAPFAVPDEATIPRTEEGDEIRHGLRLVSQTELLLPRNVGNVLRCTSCHLDAGRVANAGPWVGIVSVFPEFRTRNARTNTLEERVNDCFERSLNGKALDANGPQMRAIIAYMSWLSQDVPRGQSVEGRGFKRIEPQPTPDRARGRKLFLEKCAVCHGAEGLGTRSAEGGYLYPPLAGKRTFNIGAGMARLNTAAAFIRWNMPLGQGGSLTDQQAYDIADYFIHLPRPDFPAKRFDWPKGGKPKDARY